MMGSIWACWQGNPYLQYGNIAWAATYSTRFNCLTLLQKRAIRIVAKDSYCAHTWPRFQEYNIMKFDRVNNYHVGIFMYGYLHNMLLNSFFKFLLESRMCMSTTLGFLEVYQSNMLGQIIIGFLLQIG